MNPSPRPTGAERRLAPRYSLDLEALCRPVSTLSEPFRTAKIRDVSRTGVGLLVDLSCEAGARLLLRLAGRDGLFRKDAEARVVYARLHTSGQRWVLGCEFAEPLSEADLLALVGTTPPS
jgi:hypothetical protein